MTQYKKRFEDAVADAQYLLMYASSNCPNDIKRTTLEKLISARRRIENNEEVNAKEEADFWLAYQDIWKLVKPVTAESIKASRPQDDTYNRKPFGNIPVLSRWLGRGTTSKARGTVNRYIVFTVFILILLLILQIYWVIGNQLITELGAVSQSEELLNTQIYENQQELSAIETRLKQADPDSENLETSEGQNPLVSSPEVDGNTLENKSPTQIRLETNLASLKSKQDRYSAILRFWSSPWSGYIKVATLNVEHSEKYAPQFNEIEKKINEIENQLNNDPDGMKAATIAAQKSSLDERLAEIEAQLDQKPKPTNAALTNLTDKKLEIQAQIDKVHQKSTLDSQLINLEADKEDLQAEIDELTVQKSDLEAEINKLVAYKQDIQLQINELTVQKNDLEAEINKLKLDNNITQAPAENAVLEAPTPDSDPYVQYIQGQITDLDAYKQAIETQMGDLEVYKQVIQGQIENDLPNEIKALEVQIKNLEGKTQDIQVRIEGLTGQKNNLELEIVQFPSVVNPQEAQRIVETLNQEKQRLMAEREALELQEQAYIDQIDSRPAQLAGQFVLTILQSYLLPLLYGLLGAGTSVLRSLSKQIEEVTYSEEAGIQHLSRISLGALAGIVVGWLSFLIDSGTTSFLGSVSPLAIAFLVGYNIELFFSRMDVAIKRIIETPQQTSPTTEKAERTAVPQRSPDVPAVQKRKQSRKNPPKKS